MSSSYVAGKLQYSPQEWDTLTRQEQKVVMREQKRQRGSSRERRKELRTRLFSEAEQETLAVMPEFAELKERYEAATKVLQIPHYHETLEMQLQDLGITVKKEIHMLDDISYGVYGNHRYVPVPNESDIVLTFEDKFQTSGNIYGESTPTDEQLDQEHEKLLAFVTKLTARRKAVAHAKTGYATLRHQYETQSREFKTRVQELFKKKLEVARQPEPQQAPQPE